MTLPHLLEVALPTHPFGFPKEPVRHNQWHPPECLVKVGRQFTKCTWGGGIDCFWLVLTAAVIPFLSRNNHSIQGTRQFQAIKAPGG